MEEVWRDIEGYEGYYQVSNAGDETCVRSVDRYVTSKAGWTRLQKGVVLTQHLCGRGYPFVGLCKNNIVEQKYVHHLVACAFPEICGEKVEGWEVNHRNEIKTDNHPENLEWLPHIDNMNYGTRNQRAGEKLKGKKPTNNKLVIAYDNGVPVEVFNSVVDAGKFYEVTEGVIRGSIYGKIHLVKGRYTFEYADGTGKYSEERLREIKDEANKKRRTRYNGDEEFKQRKKEIAKKWYEKNRVSAS